MGIQRDGVSQMKFFDDLTDMTITTAAEVTVDSDAIDTKDLQGLGVVLKGDRELVAGGADEDMTFAWKECDTSDGTFTDVVDESTLPARLAPPNNKIVIPQGSLLQQVGVFATKRYVKLSVTGQPATSDYVITPRPYGISMKEEFTDYDAATVPSDGLP